MRAGTLRHRIEIEEATEAQSSSGEVTQTWASFASVWAAIQPVGGGESWRAQQVNPLLSHQVTIRWMAFVVPKMRVRFLDPKTRATRYFGIDSVVCTDEVRDELRLLCIEAVDG